MQTKTGFHRLDDNLLVQARDKALKLNLDPAFIKMLDKEIAMRSLDQSNELVTSYKTK
ncbi:sporulation histidine kinase inhibitor Sda [Halalkalibacter akibai]|uniref:Sporulation histidine kinase inhibitor Sda n=1 Tax=Halalkalibacter akibai (strain ATCC 43226 / DSM 21942 / CIP 109018 / JCM 9157 / 1139) TaxID=1236973 RepID=W4QP09_HALA3|nr:sporulation histidine kinase inhibitor Sda [Halalkalibacter akibai]GAE33069.1 hypothetical protein JCM9157_55 [Halalkalibacter akibai JCM 9157]